MPFVLPADQSPGQVASATWADDVVAALNYLSKKPSCRAYSSSAVSHASSGAAIAVTFNNERYDSAGMWVVGAPTRLTLPHAGVYLVEGGVQWDTNATGVRYLAIRVNGSTIIRLRQDNAVNDLGQTVSTVWKFAANDYVELLAFQNSGGTRTLVSASSYSPEFSATWLCLGT